MSAGALTRWQEVWEQLSDVEQRQALAAIVKRMRDPKARLERLKQTVLRSLARHQRCRIERVMRLKDEPLIAQMQPLVNVLFGPREWTLLYLGYFADHKADLMCRFMSLCGVPHDEHGYVLGGDDLIKPPDDLEATVGIMLKEYGGREVGLYFSVLRMMDPEIWTFLDPVMPRIEAAFWPAQQAFAELDSGLAQDAGSAVQSAAGGRRLAASLSGQSSGSSGIADLLPVWHEAFDKGREAALGGADLPAGRDLAVLCGYLCVLARRPDLSALKQCLTTHSRAWRKLMITSGESAPELLIDVLPALFALGETESALTLLRCQKRHVSAEYFPRGTTLAKQLAADDEQETAIQLLKLLLEALIHTPMQRSAREHQRAELELALGRLWHRQGLFEAAAEQFAPWLEDPRICDAALLTDMGLLKAGLTDLTSLQLAQEHLPLQTLRQRLEQGRPYFEDAVERFKDSAAQAHYALGLMALLDWFDHPSSEALRSSALANLSTGVRPQSGVRPHLLAVVGSYPFYALLLEMARLDLPTAEKAMGFWREHQRPLAPVPGAALERLLEQAELLQPDWVVEIGVALMAWDSDLASRVLVKPLWWSSSPILFDALCQLCRHSDDQPQERQWHQWQMLVGAALRRDAMDIAQEALDAMEELAVQKRFCEPMLHFIEDLDQVYPAWSETDVLRARFRLLRRLGRDADAYAQLRELFFALRDHRPQEAAQVLELFAECRAPGAYTMDLHLPNWEREEHLAPDIDARLEAGECVNVLFVGGNEIQARYLEDLKAQLHERWPGISVEFRLTGWSSNWGREVDGLKRLAENADVVVLMTMMRTTLGRALREALNDPPRPWVPCTGTGKKAMLTSIHHAARLAKKGTVPNS